VNVLVTGATGFIGRHLIARLLNGGDRVRALVRPATDGSDLAALGVELVRGDVRDPTAVEHAAAHCELVYHLAKASSSGSDSTVQAVNVGGTANVARAALRAGVARLIHCSSAAVYGSSMGTRPVDEDMPPMPDSRYAWSKALAERVLQSERVCANLPVVVARITGVMGPGTPRWRLLFRSVAQRQFRIPGAGSNHHHLADVSDIVEGLLLSATRRGIEGRTYNLAGSEPIRLRDLVQLIAAELGVPGELPRGFPATPFRIYGWLSGIISRITGMSLPRADGIAAIMSDRILDISRARDELGYAPRTSLPEAIHRTAEWYRAQGSLCISRPMGSGAAEHALL
jgi:nucleoside-diphosphate-sugar epimerase